MTNQILKSIGSGIENLFWVLFLIVMLPIMIILIVFDFIRERGRAYHRGALFPLGKRPSDFVRQIFVYPRQRRKLERARQEQNSAELQPLPLFPAELYEAFMDQCTLLCLQNCSLVSREWCRIARRRLFQVQINIHKRKAYRMVELIRSPYRSESFIPSIRDVGTFGDDDYFDVCDRVLFHLSAAGVQLQRLHAGFYHTPRLDPSWLSPLNLTELILSNVDRKSLRLSSSIRLITSFPALQTLGLKLTGYTDIDVPSEGAGPIVDPDPKALLSPQLQNFWVTAIPPNYKLHGLDVSRLILTCEPDLRSLQLIVSRANKENVKALRVYLSKPRRLDTLVLGLLSGADPVSKVSDALNSGYFKLFAETGFPPGLRVLMISCHPNSRMASDTISDQHQHLSSYFDRTGYASLQEIRIRVHPELYSDAKASTTVADLGILWSLGPVKLFVLEAPTQTNIRDINTLIYRRNGHVQE